MQNIQFFDQDRTSFQLIEIGIDVIEVPMTEIDSTKFVMIGLSKGDTDQFWKDIDFPIQIMNKGKLTIY